MKKIETDIIDCFEIIPDAFGDDRGYFSPYFIAKDFEELGFEKVVQTNRSKSSKGVLRGLHFQEDPKCQAKIVEVISGSAIDVVVDIRIDSPTYGKYVTLLLKPFDKNDPTSGRQLFVPRGLAHGFISLEDNTVFQYLIDNDYAKDKEGGIIYNDPKIGINWDEIFEKYDINEPLLSDKDLVLPTLENNKVLFKRNK